MTDETVTTLTPRKAKIATEVMKIAGLPKDAPVERGWTMFLSVIIGVLIGLAGAGILYAGLRVYVETKGGALSWPVLGLGALVLFAGGNHASKQLTHGSLAKSLSGLVSPLRALAGIARGGKESKDEGE